MASRPVNTSLREEAADAPLLYEDHDTASASNDDQEGTQSNFFPPDPAHRTETAEDHVSLLGALTFSWATPLIAQAASEALTLDAFSTTSSTHQSAHHAKVLHADFGDELRKARSWNPLVNDAHHLVRRRDDSQSRGVVRWIGHLQQSDRPLQVVVAVEWRVAPAEYCEASSNIAFVDGVVDGERLFYCDGKTATMELPDSLELVDGDGPAAPKTQSLIWSCLRSCGGSMGVAMIFITLQKLVEFSMPFVLQQFIQYLSGEGPSASWEWHDRCLWGTMLAVLIVSMNLLHAVGYQKFLHVSRRCGYHAQYALIGNVLHKALTISKRASVDPRFSSGRIFNLIATDSGDIEGVFSEGPECLFVPIICAVSIGLVYKLVGNAGLIGVFVLVVLLPFQAKILSGMEGAQTRLSAARDKRMRTTNELITGIRVIKAMGWEVSFIKKILSLRDVELARLKDSQRLDIATSIFEDLVPAVLCVSVLAAYHFLGNVLTADVIFPTMIVLGLLQFSLSQLPNVYTYVITARVSVRRFEQFLSALDEAYDRRQDVLPTERNAVVMEGVDVAAFAAKPVVGRRAPAPSLCPCFTGRVDANDTTSVSVGGDDDDGEADQGPHGGGDEDDDENDTFYSIEPIVLLRDVNLTIRRGHLVAVVGPTGAGKTTLLESFLGDSAVQRGEVKSVRSIAYVPQRAWIMNATIEDNIRFFDDDTADSGAQRRRLDRALKASCLDSDLEQLSHGLKTEIGERGVNLSGGQKARVALARAVYADRDLYLLDDPLAAVDVHVCQHLVTECILGALRLKTRVLVTHQAHVIAQADVVIALDAGRIAFHGTPAQYDEWLQGRDDEAEFDKQLSTSPTDRMLRFATQESIKTVESDLPSTPVKSSAVTTFMTVEEKAEGAVEFGTYQLYFKACGRHTASVVLFVFFVTQIVYTASNVWLALWTAGTFGLSTDTYLYVFAALKGVTIFQAPLRYAVVLSHGREGSRALHAALVESVARATQTFFDTTPTGRVINRFSGDIQAIDTSLPMEFLGCLSDTFEVLGTLVVVLISQPLLIVAVLPLAFGCKRVLAFYSAANREIRRLLNLSKSPVTSLASEIIDGSRSLSSYQKESFVIKEGMRRLDVNFGVSYLEMILYRWIGFRLELPVIAILALLLTVAVLVHAEDWHTPMSVSVTSLALSLTITGSSAVLWLVRSAADVEAEMNSVERVSHYTSGIPHEPLEFSNSVTTTSPTDVTLELRSVVVRYRPELEPVLKGVSARVAPRQKVGIVGRTGSGKSTLLQALLRTIEVDAGSSITFNGVAHDAMPLHELRVQFAVIPQDPVLFEGTVRSNLDPFGQCSDRALLDALEVTGLLSRVNSDGGLSASVREGGQNFSIGQRQLICVARALLKRSAAFILMDEATANIDVESDEMLQRTIRTAFSDRTVITIAHRLGTVLDYDLIVVLDAGVVVESGAPQELLSRTDGTFRQMFDAMQVAHP